MAHRTVLSSSLLSDEVESTCLFLIAFGTALNRWTVYDLVPAEFSI